MISSPPGPRMASRSGTSNFSAALISAFAAASGVGKLFGAFAAARHIIAETQRSRVARIVLPNMGYLLPPPPPRRPPPPPRERPPPPREKLDEPRLRLARAAPPLK